MLIVVELNDGAVIPKEVLEYCDTKGYAVETDNGKVYLSKEPERIEYVFPAINGTFPKMDYATATVVSKSPWMMNCMKFISKVHRYNATHIRRINWEDENPTLLDQMMALTMFEQELEKKRESDDDTED